MFDLQKLLIWGGIKASDYIWIIHFMNCKCEYPILIIGIFLNLENTFKILAMLFFFKPNSNLNSEIVAKILGYDETGCLFNFCIQLSSLYGPKPGFPSLDVL